MSSVTVRIPDSVKEDVLKLWAQLPTEVQGQIMGYYRHAVARGGWVDEGEPIDGIQVKKWSAKERKTGESWRYLCDMSVREGLRLYREGYPLLQLPGRGGSSHDFKFRGELEVEEIKAIPVVEDGVKKRGRPAGISQVILRLMITGLREIAKVHEVEL